MLTCPSMDVNHMLLLVSGGEYTAGDPSRRLFVEMASFSNYWKRKGPVTRRTCFLLHVAGNSVRRSQERQRKRSQRKENRNEM